MATFSLTKKQQAVYDFIKSYFDEYRRSPLIREIQLGCQITSYKSAIDRLNTLERKGCIRRLPHKHRGIKLPKRGIPESNPPSLEASVVSSAASSPDNSVTSEPPPVEETL